MIFDIVYKVVKRCRDGKYGPAGLWGYGKVTYDVGQWTYAPKGWGPLAAFSSLPAAIWAAISSGTEGIQSLLHIAEGYCVIFECAYAPFKRKRRETNPESPVVLWSREGREEHVLRLHQMPPRTILCGGVQPVRKVTVKEIAAYLEPGAVIRQTLFTEQQAILPCIMVAQSNLAGCPLVDDVVGADDRVQRFLHKLGREGRPFAKVAKTAFEIADKLARAYHVKQPRFLED